VQRLLGYGANELLGRNAFEFMHPDDLAPVMEALADAIQQPGSPQTATFRFRLPMARGGCSSRSVRRDSINRMAIA